MEGKIESENIDEKEFNRRVDVVLSDPRFVGTTEQAKEVIKTLLDVCDDCINGGYFIDGYVCDRHQKNPPVRKTNEVLLRAECECKDDKS